MPLPLERAPLLDFAQAGELRRRQSSRLLLLVVLVRLGLGWRRSIDRIVVLSLTGRLLKLPKLLPQRFFAHEQRLLRRVELLAAPSPRLERLELAHLFL